MVPDEQMHDERVFQIVGTVVWKELELQGRL